MVHLVHPHGGVNGSCGLDVNGSCAWWCNEWFVCESFLVRPHGGGHCRLGVFGGMQTWALIVHPQ
jgi:hypothetical protein